MDQDSLFKKISIYHDESNNSYNSHVHSFYEMIYIIKGEAQILFRNKMFIAGPQTITFISNYEDHSVAMLEEPYHRYVLKIMPAFADRIIQDSRLLSVFKNRPVSFVNVFDISQINTKIRTLFELLESELGIDDYYTDDSVARTIKCILISIFRNNENQFPVLRDSVKSQIYDVQRYIDEHFKEDIRIEELAELYYINGSYLSRCFKELAGCSPKQYLSLMRVSHANYLIGNSDLSIMEIALNSGFNNVNSFIRQYREHYGVTPNSTRKALRTNTKEGDLILIKKSSMQP
jgi:AraC-type DNA-binding domain-containing proteins